MNETGIPAPSNDGKQIRPILAKGARRLTCEMKSDQKFVGRPQNQNARGQFCGKTVLF
jgi:hypothetical protein